MSYAFEYKSGLDNRSIGEVVQSPINLETRTKGQWIALDGRDCNRSQFPEIQSMFPAGVFTSTARTLAGVPANAVITADNTNFIAPNVAGAAAVQVSADGISWSTGSSWAASTAISSLIIAGTRFVAASSAGMTTPAVINTNQSAAITAAWGNWTATTGGTTTTLTQGLAYGSTANAGAGRTVLCVNGSLATASGLFYMNDGATAWNACSGGSTADRKCVVWTGQKFIVFLATATQNLYQVSTDGATFADAYLPEFVSALYSAISDGNGTVVASVKLNIDGTGGIGMCFLVSKDHGATWRQIMPGVGMTNIAPTGTGSFINGKFVFPAYGTNQTFISSDGIGWQLEPIGMRGIAVNSVTTTVFAYKAGTYCGIGTATAALTATEDMSKFRINSLLPISQSIVGFVPPSEFMNTYIKVRSN